MTQVARFHLTLQSRFLINQAIALLLILVAISCQKETFITSPDARMIIRADTLRFDTVFTSAGSVTKRFTLVNDNDQKLRISRIRLAGGSTSSYAININGQATPEATNIDVNPNDSIYLFVKVTIDPNSSNSPFLVRDSIQIEYNANTRWVHLEAYGQNARYVNGGVIATHTSWNNQLPWVILQPILVAPGVTLTLEKGVKVFCQSTASLVIGGTLRCLGEVAEADRVVFRGNRTDLPYRDYPGSWPGILFVNGSTGNLLRYTRILNAWQALVTEGNANATPAKLVLEQCEVNNAYDVGVFALNSSIQATNCRITQCGNDGQPGAGGSNLIVSGGGNYLFEHCTIATYGNAWQNHRQPVVVMGNSRNGITNPLNARFFNTIVWGEGGLPTNEVLVTRTDGPPFSILFQNVLYRSTDPLQNVTLQDVLINQPPQFDSISTTLQYYNFRLREISPAVNAGRPTTLPTDLDGLPRLAGTRPDLGCYERQ